MADTDEVIDAALAKFEETFKDVVACDNARFEHK